MQSCFDLRWLHVRFRSDNPSYDLQWNQYTVSPGNQHQYVPLSVNFPVTIPDSNALFPSWPIGISVLISIWLHCDCNYVFLFQLIVFAAFSSSLLCKKSLRWCLTRVHVTRNKLFLGSAIYLFLFSALLATQRFH